MHGIRSSQAWIDLDDVICELGVGVVDAPLKGKIVHVFDPLVFNSRNFKTFQVSNFGSMCILSEPRRNWVILHQNSLVEHLLYRLLDFRRHCDFYNTF